MRRHLMVVTLLFAPSLAAAQESPEDVARARELFGEGVDQHEARRYDEAVETFRAVLAIRAAPAVRYNLALNLFELGQYPEADAEVERLLEDPESPPELEDAARELRTHMEERGGQLQVEAELAPTAHVEIDGYAVANPRRPVRVLAGTHRVTVVDGEDAVAEDVVTVGVGQTKVVRPTAEEGTREANLFDIGSAEPVTKDWRFWVALGVVAAVAVTLVVVAIVDDDDGGAAGTPLVSW